VEQWLALTEVCRRLGVKPATVYAYVSRGQLSSRPAGGSRRGSEYDPADVERLLRRGRRASGTHEPVVKTAIADVRPGVVRYRGVDVGQLAGARPFEAVAELLWTGTLPVQGPVWSADDAMLAAGASMLGVLPEGARPLERMRAVVAAAPLADPFRSQVDHAATVDAGRRLLATTVAVLLPGAGVGGVAARLASGLLPSAVTDAWFEPLLDAVLVLVADHGLAASTFAVRVAASARADLAGALLAGLGVLSGTRHGGAAGAAEEALGAAFAHARPEAEAVRRLDRPDGLLGFGLAQHPDGDPRAALLLRHLETSVASRGEDGTTARWDVLRRVLAGARDRGVPPPNVDLALAALTAVHDLPLGTAELVFGLGRMAGWVAHALEQLADPGLLRPRGVYVGPP
jgi:citrate synthase